MIGKLLGLVMGLVSGVGFSQFPEFAQQYTQRLGGRLDELRDFVKRFDEDAARSGLTRHAALAEFTRTDSAFLRARGTDATVRIERFERYDTMKGALDRAMPFERLYVFVRDYDREIAEAAWTDFKPAIPATTEGLAHAGVGFLAGLFGVWSVGAAGRRMMRRKPDEPEVKPVP